MNDPAVIILNERCKVASSTTARLGSVLLAAGIAELYLKGKWSWGVIASFPVALVLFYLSYQILSLMQKEA